MTDMLIPDQPMLDNLLTIAQRAGAAILAVYGQTQSLEVDYKADDSPITQADRAAHTAIVTALLQAYPGIPVLSEESPPQMANKRLGWEQFWLVDPLDGTKEFISRNGEFTVNIALIQCGEPVAGVVLAPVLQKSYLGARGLGAFCVTGEEWASIRTRQRSQQRLQVVGSRRHGAEALEALLTKLRQQIGQVEMKNVGSSLKFCLIAEGEADFYPRLAPTSEWDTAAAQAVLEAAGGAVVDLNFQPLRYNKPDSLLNPSFYALAQPSTEWLADNAV